MKLCVVCPRLSATIAAQKCSANPLGKSGLHLVFVYMLFSEKTKTTENKNCATFWYIQTWGRRWTWPFLTGLFLAYDIMYFLNFQEFLQSQLFYTSWKEDYALKRGYVCAVIRESSEVENFNKHFFASDIPWQVLISICFFLGPN